VEQSICTEAGYDSLWTWPLINIKPLSKNPQECTCNNVDPKAMTYKEMFEEPFLGATSNIVAEFVIKEIGDIEVEASMNPSGTNETTTLALDSMDSTPTTVERMRNRPSISCQISMDKVLQEVLCQKLDKIWASFFYEANIAFNVMRHYAFVNAVMETMVAKFLY